MRKILFPVLLLFTAVPVAAQNTPSFPKEISVTGEARLWSAADVVRINFLLEEQGKNAESAEVALKAKVQKFLQSLQPFSPLQTVVRSENFLSAALKGTALTPGAAVKLQRTLGVELKASQNIGKLIDTALAQGATEVSSQEYFPVDDQTARLEASALASSRAKEQASRIAETLGLKLGAVLSANITEEPPAQVLREAFQKGALQTDFSERNTVIYANIRFEVMPK